jgi:predicted helicase
MSNFKLKPTHAPVKAYYETLEKCARGKFDNEGNIRRAFEGLLEKCAHFYDWFVVGEYQIARSGKSPLRVDAAVLDAFNLPRGYWEAKDEKDDLKAEMNKKFALGYPRTNILFQAPTRAILVQDGRIAFDGDITDPEKIVDVLRQFFEYREPHIEDWDRAVREFSGRIPEIARGALDLIWKEHKTNAAFRERFASFADLCRESINPELKDEAVEEMLVQHLLTERIFRRIFSNSDFTRRNVIAAEIEKVISSLTERHFSRDTFLSSLDLYYKAIEEAAAPLGSYSEKQHFLNKVHEQFFRGVNPRQADIHGIVYTPQPIVDFMVRSVEEILREEFGRGLSDKGVHVLDPFVGTGNFITRVMNEIKTSSLPHKYKEELHCNEIMLLPYYIASMNIEHAYLDAVSKYEPFEGICFVDTFELTEARQGSLFVTENLARVTRQKNSKITVVIGNPPYNVGQEDENDNNPNPKHKWVDSRVAETYRARSKASSTTKLGNLYVRAIRWASDRIGEEGIVALVTNNGFITKRVFDGMRQCLPEDFDAIYVLDLGGDVRDNTKLSGTTHNVFGIQPGVSISFFIKKIGFPKENRGVHYARVEEYWRKEQKFAFLEEKGSVANIGWQHLNPLADGTWLTNSINTSFDDLMPIAQTAGGNGVFKMHSMGVTTNRDAWTFNFDRRQLAAGVIRMLEVYNSERLRLHSNRFKSLSSLTADNKKIKWSSSLKAFLKRNLEGVFEVADIRGAVYRPFISQFLYFNSLLTHRRGRLPKVFPTKAEDGQNTVLAVPGPGNRKAFGIFATSYIPSLDLAFEKGQCFPFWVYPNDVLNRRENITDWALGEFRKHYGDQKISKWDIFHYIYGILHHPEYRTRYAANLKRELPRIPMAPEFARYAEIGAALMKLHIEYEQQAEYPLEHKETGKLDWRVEKMALSKDKTQLKYNEFLTFSGIPPEAYEYRLGNRSALEWVVDQYRVSTDARSGIVNDPNREDDPEYIVRLVGQVVTVSVETVRLVKELAALPIDQV